MRTLMNAEEFEQQLVRDGFTKPIPGHYEAHRVNAQTNHHTVGCECHYTMPCEKLH